MTPLPRSLYMQKVTIALFFILAAIQAYAAVSAPGGLNLRGAALIASPLGMMNVFLAKYQDLNKPQPEYP